MFAWHGREFRCLDTPGNSPGGMSYLLQHEGRLVAFSGDVMLAGRKMHTWFDTEWDYGFAAGIHAAAQISQLLWTSHDPHPGFSLRTGLSSGIRTRNCAIYRELRATSKSSICAATTLKAASVAYQDKVSKPTVVSNVVQVSPHIFKFKRLNFWPNFALILADSGRALVVDCGLLDETVPGRGP